MLDGLRERFELDAESDMMFVDLSGMTIKSKSDLTRLRKACEDILNPHGRRVAVVADFNALDLRPEISGPFFDMVAQLERRYFLVAARYATSTFTRFKLEAALERRGLAANIFTTRHQAQAYINAPYKKLAKGGPLHLPFGSDDGPPLGARRVTPKAPAKKNRKKMGVSG